MSGHHDDSQRVQTVTTALRRYRREQRSDNADESGDRVHRELLLFARAFGKPFAGFKSAEQELVIRKVIAGESVLAVMPTGSGKSLTYQLPAFIDRKRVTLVISPLKALMEQHAELPLARCINSDTELEQRSKIWKDLKEGKRNILLVSPEMLARQYARLARLPIGRFVVDEVHCVSDWGHDFRPHYWWVSHYLRQIEKKRGQGRIPRLLLTATADRRVLQDIRLHFPEVDRRDAVVRASIGREEIVLCAKNVHSAKQRVAILTRFLERQRTRALPSGTARRGIVFNLEAVGGEEEVDLTNRDRLKADQVASLLRRRGFRKAYAYASRGMKAEQRKDVLSKFEAASARKGQITVVVATNAFGMGMDYAAVPFVCHLYPRPTVVEYWQQVGRAGRGLDTGHRAEALALYSRGDFKYALRFAKAPALDGLLNAFTIPVHGWMYVWTRHGADMCLLGRGGGRTRFSRLLADLQEEGVVELAPQKVEALRGVVRYRVDIRRLRSASGREALEKLARKYSTTKRLRKVFRYLRIAMHSRQHQCIVLDQTDYKADRMGTVLQRLNRWVDNGLLQRDDRAAAGQIRLRVVGRNLTTARIRRIVAEAHAWGKHKKVSVLAALTVLKARSPRERRRRVMRHFGERRAAGPIGTAIPPWLAR